MREKIGRNKEQLIHFWVTLHSGILIIIPQFLGAVVHYLAEVIHWKKKMFLVELSTTSVTGSWFLISDSFLHEAKNIPNPPGFFSSIPVPMHTCSSFV